jgi:DNA repair protein RecO (recombination protein O)
VSAPAAEVPALVLGSVDYGEADRIVQLLTPDRGRISALARGARRSKKRFAGALDLGNRITALLRPGRGDLWHLQGAHLEHGHPHLRKDLDRIALAAYACELVAALAPQDQPAPKLFGLLDVALLVLDAVTEPPRTAWRVGLEAKALSFAGLTPNLVSCDTCDEPLLEPLVFSPSAGSLRHAHCGEGRRVSLALAQAIERARRTPLSELVDLDLPPGEPWLIYEHLQWHQGKPLRSRELLLALPPS